MDEASDEFLEALVDAIAHQNQSQTIQGFLYADHHVIRDLSKPWAEQEIWRKYGPKGLYDEVHGEMMRQIEIEIMRRAVGLAHRTLERRGAPLPRPDGGRA